MEQSQREGTINATDGVGWLRTLRDNTDLKPRQSDPMCQCGPLGEASSNTDTLCIWTSVWGMKQRPSDQMSCFNTATEKPGQPPEPASTQKPGSTLTKLQV